jgi:GNAT superfamily N-acetyltransferase
MPLTLHCQQIRPDQLETFSGVIRAVAQAFENEGRKLWDQTQLLPERLLNDYGLESMYIGWNGNNAVATFVLLEQDPLFFPDVPAGESLFLHKVAVARAWKGHGLSTQILDFVMQQARAQGKRFVRLDTDATRPVLCELYERYGFTRVGRRMIGRFDTALYELEVGA